jgi:hypothetical protein
VKRSVTTTLVYRSLGGSGAEGNIIRMALENLVDERHPTFLPLTCAVLVIMRLI